MNCPSLIPPWTAPLEADSVTIRELTMEPGFRRMKAHGPTPYPQHRIQAPGGAGLPGWRDAPYYDKPAISIDDTALVETMAAISESFEAYGYRRMQAALRHRGLIVNHKKIRRLMREHGLQPGRRRRYIATTDGDHELPIFPIRGRALPAGPRRTWSRRIDGAPRQSIR